jgi:hypothetical protein
MIPKNLYNLVVSVTVFKIESTPHAVVCLVYQHMFVTELSPHPV